MTIKTRWWLRRRELCRCLPTNKWVIQGRRASEVQVNASHILCGGEIDISLFCTLISLCIVIFLYLFTPSQHRAWHFHAFALLSITVLYFRSCGVIPRMLNALRRPTDIIKTVKGLTHPLFPHASHDFFLGLRKSAFFPVIAGRHKYAKWPLARLCLKLCKLVCASVKLSQSTLQRTSLP